MNKKTRELVLIKSGEYMLDISKLVFGGIVLVVIMQIENMSNQILLISGSIAVALTAILGLFFTSKSQSNKKKGE
ncbi:MAG: ABC transporter permease [Paludibacteraceae bacterium]|nr:ABC transporter permease [Paludibacteraceae bacterium]